MNKTIFALVVSVMIMFSVPAYAQKNADVYVSGTEWLYSTETGDIVVDGNTILRFEDDAEIRGNIRIETGSGIEIVGGAKVTLTSGEIVCEQGSFIDISNGMLKISGGSRLDNFGTITTQENGRLKILSGSVISRAGGIVNNGKITCLSSGKNINTAFSAIAKFDNNFSLANYSLYITSNADVTKVNAYYCIGGKAETSYCYTTVISKSKTTIKRTNYSPHKVYSPITSSNVLEKTADFEKDHSLPAMYSDGFKRRFNYKYSYKTGKLIFEATWFNWDSEEEIYYEGFEGCEL